MKTEILVFKLFLNVLKAACIFPQLNLLFIYNDLPPRVNDLRTCSQSSECLIISFLEVGMLTVLIPRNELHRILSYF